MSFRARVLLHPLFLLSLFLLLANDHVLKHSSYHGVLTGKLSDFAGLIVAPVVLAELLHVLCTNSAMKKRFNLLACVAVGAFFTALKTVPFAAAAYDQTFFFLLRMPSHTVVDATDLLALPILPLTHWLLQRPNVRDGGANERASWRHVFAQSALVVAMLACVATSAPRERAANGKVFLVNQTNARVDVRVRWYRGSFDCSRAARDFRLFANAFQNRALFGQGLTFRLEAKESAALDQSNAWSQANTREPDSTVRENLCDVALVAADGVPELLVLVDNTLPQTTRRTSSTVEQTDGSTLSLLADPAPRFSPGNVPATRFDPSTRAQCAAHLTPSLRTSDPGLVGDNTVTLTQKERNDDCFDLELQRGVATTPFFVCVPESLFPFAVGDRLTFRSTATALQISNLSHELTIDAVRRNALGDMTLGALAIRVAENISPCGIESACGAFDVPAVTSLRYNDQTPTPEEDGTVVFAGQQRIALGGAFTRVAAHASCDGALGSQFTYARLRPL